ncbi:MAG: DDE-type integrase/transposase/recombinase, partial [Candidatus Thiodiazotropha endolucinida]|nr:DDE-type integrase/transposase/recombinase [Candidatus Thiodiazotropha taylori]MCW4264223.1 DDE-type integrase/transposase/recombinase [Candidatus Thiodiazotropha endolucinida]
MDKEKDKLLEEYYFNAINPGAFSGPQKLFRVLNKKYPGRFSFLYIKNWLNNQDAYSIQRQVRRKFKTPNVRVSSIDEQFQADLADVSNISKFNSGIHYLLFVIDVFSKYLWVKPLKNKTAKSVIAAMTSIFLDRKPKKLQTDKGSEFVNRWFKKFMADQDIYFFTTHNVPKASIVERSQRTFKAALYRLMRKKRTYRFIDNLDELVASYNASPHRSLNYLSPREVNEDNEADVWANMYLKKPKRKRKSKMTSYKPPIRFKKGQLVRVSLHKRPFVKSYDDQFSTEVFKVASVKLVQGIPMYKLQDLKQNTIQGQFYNSELLAVNKDADSLWFIEKVLKKRRRGG